MLTQATGDAELVLWDGREFGHWCSVKTFKRSTDRRSASDVARYVQLLQFANALVPINRANSANRAIRFQD